MNTISIELNNRAVAHLQAGNMFPAFELLIKASAITMKGVANHTQHTGSGKPTFCFHWDDCSKAAACNMFSPNSTWEGSTPFLFLRTIRITIADNVKVVEKLCPGGYAWSIWFNLAICCSLIGTRLGEKGQKILGMAFDLYNRVQKRIDNELQSKHWNLLQMAVLNNQACIFHDFAMGDATKECMEHLALTILQQANTDAGPGEDKTKVFFMFNLQILGSDSVAAAA